MATLYDSGVWLALTFSAHPHHSLALAEHAQATARKPACFCRATQQSFLRLATTPVLLKAYGTPGLTNRDALQIYGAFAKRKEIAFLEETPGLQKLWFELADSTSASAKVWMDAYLSALAICHDATFATLDGDFRKFEVKGLKLRLLTP